MTSYILDGNLPQGETYKQLLPILLPQASNRFAAPMIRHEGKPDAQSKIAADAGISEEEYTLWGKLFETLKSP